jgi:tetratricopeptide (TPR) repeat protein
MTAAVLARVLCERQEVDEALRWAEKTRDLAAPEDVQAQAIQRGVQARIRAQQGAVDDAERLAREAVALTAQTDQEILVGDALLDLADVLSRAGRRADAGDAARQALARYENKGHEVFAARARAMLDEIGVD